jgi:CDP-diacylglycerol pyrophosphatase
MLRSIKLSSVVIAALLLAAVSLAVLKARTHYASDALWKIVHVHCVPDLQANRNPAPCVSVDTSQGNASGFAILKDKQGNTQYLLIPTEKITGIESPAILAPSGTNYFAAAWSATNLVDRKLNRILPRTDFALAINSISGRSQDQLHIHIDCIQPTLKSVLAQMAPQIETTWQTLPVKLSGHQYRAMWLPGAELGQQNPFRLLADSLPNPAREMAGHTLVLAGAQRNGQPGFILLDSHAPQAAVAVASLVRLGFASGEELEDHSCRVAQAG